MDTLLGKGLESLANIVINKWFAAMGLVGLLLFAASLLFTLPTDPIVVGCIGLIMMGYGFGQAECRTFVQGIRGQYKTIEPHWQLTVSGALLFAIAIGAAIKLALHLN